MAGAWESVLEILLDLHKLVCITCVDPRRQTSKSPAPVLNGQGGETKKVNGEQQTPAPLERAETKPRLETTVTTVTEERGLSTIVRVQSSTETSVIVSDKEQTVVQTTTTQIETIQQPKASGTTMKRRSLMRAGTSATLPSSFFQQLQQPELASPPTSTSPTNQTATDTLRTPVSPPLVKRGSLSLLKHESPLAPPRSLVHSTSAVYDVEPSTTQLHLPSRSR